ncbi:MULTISPECIES: hypothetical protein [Xenorhabdus]|uniref:hypothetical protein n=1 Tax=Xenorhabdus TaxID=626 RepID=UPI000649770F|nr:MULTISPECIES: hypothetical protein [Xenorhabdus]KLU14714.1 hypothetical protein AAY47_14885 [Xenorhabdus griffiniae]KOP31843.1 hypothetical protein AFK69_18725 [Xenorhabdus sp. GDc328]
MDKRKRELLKLTHKYKELKGRIEEALESGDEVPKKWLDEKFSLQDEICDLTNSTLTDELMERERESMTDEALIYFLKEKLLIITAQLATVKCDFYPDQERIDKAIRASAYAVDTIEKNHLKF